MIYPFQYKFHGADSSSQSKRCEFCEKNTAHIKIFDKWQCLICKTITVEHHKIVEPIEKPRIKSDKRIHILVKRNKQ